MERLNELFDKYNVSEKNNSTGNFKKLKKTILELDKLDKVLLLSCSNRYNWDDNKIDIPKSTILAMIIQEYLGDKAVLIDVPELKIYPCEGNVSRSDGNSCGLKKAMLKSDSKNPSGYHRCWASINNKDDELWKISKELFDITRQTFDCYTSDIRADILMLVMQYEEKRPIYKCLCCGSVDNVIDLEALVLNLTIEPTDKPVEPALVIAVIIA